MNGLYGNPTLYIAKTKSKLKRENIYFQNNNKKLTTMFSKSVLFLMKAKSNI